MIRAPRFSPVLPAFCFLAAALASACGSTSKDAASSQPGNNDHTPADAGAKCGADWAAECARQSCDPTSAGWQGCKINGWSGYVAAPHCAATASLPGDDAALCAPGPDEGIQLHLGPANYDDPAEVKKYMLDPGAEAYDCVLQKTPNVTGKYFGRYLERSRPGAHHVQLTYALSTDTTPSGTTRPCNVLNDLLLTAGNLFAFSQVPTLDMPDLSTPKPAGAADAGGLDFEGSAAPMDPDRMLLMLSHYLNNASDPVLKEAWFNIYFSDRANVKAALYTISMISQGIKIPAHSSATFRRSCPTTIDRNVKFLQGHSHVGMQRFSIWHAPAGAGMSAEQKVYESYDPLEPADLEYSPFVTNHAPDPTARTPGGASGALHLQAGDSIVWECAFDNPTAVDIGDGDGDPKPLSSDSPISGAQMCYTYGSFAVPISQTGADAGPAAANWSCGGTTPTTL